MQMRIYIIACFFAASNIFVTDCNPVAGIVSCHMSATCNFPVLAIACRSNLSKGHSLLSEVHIMLKRIAPVFGAAILALGALSACGDSPSAPETTGSAIDQVQKLTVGNATPTSNTTGDQATSIFKPKPFERQLNALRLSDDQKAKARRCLEQYYNCLKESEAAYKRAVNGINSSYERYVREIKAQVANGRITAEKGRELIKIAGERARSALKAALETARGNVATCEKNFQRCIREVLTREQIAKWEKITTNNGAR